MILPGGVLRAETARWLSTSATQLLEDREVRVVVLRSAVGFCSGAAPDLAIDSADPDPATAIARLRVPVIAAVAGPCHSVGLELALVCDLRVATTSATFAVPDVCDGRLPAWGATQRLPRAVGASRAAWMLLLGRELDAATALQWGIVHTVAETLDELDTRVADLVEQLLANGPLALEFAKEAIHRGSELPLRDGLRLEGDLNHQLAATEDRAEGLAAFFDKRPPDFAGR